MSINAPLHLHSCAVQPEWIDYNGHMNLAYFVLAFDHATDAFFDYLGMDSTYRAETGLSPYLLETHVTYYREMKLGEQMHFTTQLLDYDEKRLHYFHFMHRADEGQLAATTELMFINVDTRQGRASPMPAAVLENLANVMQAHRTLATPPDKGRIIGIRRKTPD